MNIKEISKENIVINNLYLVCIEAILKDPSDYILLDFDGSKITGNIISNLNENDIISSIEFFKNNVHIVIKAMSSPYFINLYSYTLISLHEVWTVFESFYDCNNELINYSYSFTIDIVTKHLEASHKFVDTVAFKISNLKYDTLIDLRLNETLNVEKISIDETLYTITLCPSGYHYSNEYTLINKKFNRILGLNNTYQWKLL